MARAMPPVIIDLLQWLDPHDQSPPYPHLYHYGIARVALTTRSMMPFRAVIPYSSMLNAS